MNIKEMWDFYKLDALGDFVNDSAERCDAMARYSKPGGMGWDGMVGLEKAGVGRGECDGAL